LSDVNALIDAPLAELTTLRLGGPARRLIEAGDTEAIVTAVRDADRVGERLLVLAGGSNVVLPDEGVTGTVLALRSRGIEAVDAGDSVQLTAAAGHPWDEFVACAVGDGLAGVECLSGIPGSVGATPVQNVGAYGQEVAQAIVSVAVLDRDRGEVRTLPAAECGFAYRTSIFKRSNRWVVLEVTFALTPATESGPLRFGELTTVLGVMPGGHAPLAEIRAAVLRLRARKGMVLDAADRDTWSVGSFFTNPVLEPAGYGALAAQVRTRFGAEAQPPAFPEPDGRVKTSAAWLIERAGFGRGYGRDGVGLSSKHTLALTNRGTGTTRALLALAREVRDGVQSAFGVTLEPEPVIIDSTGAPTPL
jgi:UDP-N-acetylmuramate dehydrogenase